MTQPIDISLSLQDSSQYDPQIQQCLICKSYAEHALACLAQPPEHANWANQFLMLSDCMCRRSWSSSESSRFKVTRQPTEDGLE